MNETDTNSIGNLLPGFQQKLQSRLLSVESFQQDTTVVVATDGLVDALEFLKTSLHFNMLLDIVGMDYLKYSMEQRERFAVIYILYSFERKTRIRVKVFVNEEACELPSIHRLYAAANWFEREVWDLFGVVFSGHPNLVRILCHQEFEGHPLRKDYPSDRFQALKTAIPSSDI